MRVALPTITFDGTILVNNSPVTSEAFFLSKLSNCIRPLSPVNATLSSALAVCNGDITTLSASGSGNLSWFSADSGGIFLGNGTSFATGAITASTTFYVQDSTCSASTRTSITVTALSKPAPVIALLGSDTLMTGVFSSYQWLENGAVISMATQQSYAATSNGNYQVAVTNADGCTDTSVLFNVVSVGIDLVNKQNTVFLYPNPSNGSMYFNGLRTGYTVEVYNLLDEMIYSNKTYNNSGYYLDLTDNMKGIYFYRIADEIGNTAGSGKFIIQ